MFNDFLPHTILALAFGNSLIRAASIGVKNDLAVRDNKYQLKCSNAPNVVAGEFLDPSNDTLTTSLPLSGSSDQWTKYLYCTPGTKTYTFFNIGEMNPAPGTGTATAGYRNIHGAFNQAAEAVRALAQNDGPIADGAWTMKPKYTNIEIKVQNAVGKLTYGILDSAFTGLTTATLNYNPQNNPMVFQINDGQWGEVGIGYAGYNNAVGQCIIVQNATANYPCSHALNGYLGDNFH